MRTTWAAIAFLYSAIVVVAVLLLAGVQVRAPVGSAYDIWSLNFDANQEREHQLSKIRIDTTDTLDKLDAAKLCLLLYNDDGASKASIDSQLLNAARAARAEQKEAGSFSGEMYCLVRGYLNLLSDKHYYEKISEKLTQDVTALEVELQANAAERTALLKDRPEYPAFKQMETKWYSKLTVIIPYDLMVILLVMFMGALGGMVRILRDYGDPTRRNPAAAEYIFIPLIGLVVAIGGYILAKTGLLLLSSAKQEASLSPFMIGLVGIISGLLAKDVIDALARTGKKIVQGESGEEGSDGSPPARPNQSNLTNMAAGRDEPDRAKTRIDDHGVE